MLYNSEGHLYCKKCQFNKHLVFVTRNKSGGCSILHTESLVGFVLEE